MRPLLVHHIYKYSSSEDQACNRTELRPLLPVPGEKPEGVGSGCVQSRDERGGPPVSERVVLVEKEGCASVVSYPERRTARVLFADGTVITGNSRAEYEVRPVLV